MKTAVLALGLLALAATPATGILFFHQDFEYNGYSACNLNEDCGPGLFCALGCFTGGCVEEANMIAYCQPCNLCLSLYDGWEHGPSDCRDVCEADAVPLDSDGEFISLAELASREFSLNVEHAFEYLGEVRITDDDADFEETAENAPECAHICLRHQLGGQHGSKACRAFSYDMDNQVCNLHTKFEKGAVDSSFISGRLVISSEYYHVLSSHYNAISQQWLEEQWELNSFFVSEPVGPEDWDPAMADFTYPGKEMDDAKSALRAKAAEEAGSPSPEASPSPSPEASPSPSPEASPSPSPEASPSPSPSPETAPARRLLK